MATLRATSSKAPPAKWHRQQDSHDGDMDLINTFNMDGDMTDYADIDMILDRDTSMGDLRTSLEMGMTRVNYKMVGMINNDQLLFPVHTVTDWAGKLAGLKTWTDNAGSGVDPLDVLISRAIPAHPGDMLELDTLIRRTFKSASVPSYYKFDLGDQLRVTSWWRLDQKMGGTLASGKDLVHRTLKNRSFTWWLLLVTAWPLPISANPEPGCQYLWSFELNAKASDEETLLMNIVATLQKLYLGYVYRAVRNSCLPPISWLINWGVDQ